MKLLFALAIVTLLAGCVGTREGDYETPEFRLEKVAP